MAHRNMHMRWHIFTSLLAFGAPAGCGDDGEPTDMAGTSGSMDAGATTRDSGSRDGAADGTPRTDGSSHLDAGGDASSRASEQITLTAEGGRYQVLDGLVRFDVPAGAVSEPTELTVTDLPGGLPEQHIARAFRIEPHGLTFAEPVQITLPFDPEAGPGDAPVIYMKQHPDGTWETVANAEVDRSAGRATAPVWSLSTHGIQIGSNCRSCLLAATWDGETMSLLVWRRGVVEDLRVVNSFANPTPEDFSTDERPSYPPPATSTFTSFTPTWTRVGEQYRATFSLTPGRHFVRIRFGDGSTTAYTYAFRVGTETPPPAPASLVGTVVPGTGVRLYVTFAPFDRSLVSPPTAIEFDRNTSGSFELVHTEPFVFAEPDHPHSWTDTTAPLDAQVTYRARARNAVGASDWSVTEPLVVAPQSCIFTPAALHATAGSMGYINVSFEDPGSGPTSYVLTNVRPEDVPWQETLSATPPVWQDVAHGEAQLILFPSGSITTTETFPLRLEVLRETQRLCSGQFDYVIN